MKTSLKSALLLAALTGLLYGCATPYVYDKTTARCRDKETGQFVDTNKCWKEASQEVKNAREYKQ